MSDAMKKPPASKPEALRNLVPGHEPADLAAVFAGGLVPIVPDFLARSDGASIGYRGQIHWIQGEPESGKSWMAILACVQAIAAGGRATYVDYETNVVRFLLRLQALGMAPEDVIRGLTYVHPNGPVRAHLDHYRGLFAGRDVVVIDACTAAMAAEGLNPDKALEVANWMSLLPQHAVDEGAAAFVIDHVVKSMETRGRWATGSGHKLAATDVAFSVKAVHLEPMAPGRRGRAWIHFEKDRDGGVKAIAEAGSTTIADLVLDASVEPATLSLDPPSAAPVKASTADRIYELVPDVPETIGLDEIADELGLAAKTIKNTLTGPRLRNFVHNVAPKNKAAAWQRYE
jgi:hypothetical protein